MAELTDAQRLEAEKIKTAALENALKKNKAVSVVSDSNATTFKNGKDTYEVVCVAFNHKGIKYTALDLVNNPDLQAELIELGAGFLKKL